MKICPTCKAIFDDSMNFCLEHGIDLVDAATHSPDTIQSLASEKTQQLRDPVSTQQQNVTAPTVFGTPPRKKNSLLPILLIVGLAVLFIGAAAIGGALYLYNRNTAINWEPPPTPRPPLITPTPTPEEVKKLNVEVIGTEDGSFGDKFVKVMVTNIANTVLEKPSVDITFYEKDVKVGSRFESLPIEFLRPGETYPAWVRIAGLKKYDRMVAEQGGFTRISKRPVTEVFPDLAVTEKVLTTEKKNSSINFRTYTENYYMAAAIIENTTAKAIRPSIDVVYYDEKGEVVGYTSAHVGELKPGDKAKIDAQAAQSQIHGKPTRFEVVVTVD